MFDDINSKKLMRLKIFIMSDKINVCSDSNASNDFNKPIVFTEVRSAIKRLKRNKASCPADNLLNEYFKESGDILAGHLTDLFNHVLIPVYSQRFGFTPALLYHYIKRGQKSS